MNVVLIVVYMFEAPPLYKSLYLSSSQLSTLSVEDILDKQISLISLNLDSTAAHLFSNWLERNPELILGESSSKNDGRWGLEWNITLSTAFFSLDYEYSDGCVNGGSVSPNYNPVPELSEYQLKNTPTILELYLGFLKKYPKNMNAIRAKPEPELDRFTYLSRIHPKSLYIDGKLNYNLYRS
ncbi:hypothetical protein NRA61_18370 [Acinetobacter baumannii]|nr:hypothetical protein [Acinetobacter baumannii]